MDFIAIDFETANELKTSACSVGLVKVKNGAIVDEFYTLINPLSEFNYRNVRVHGIQSHMVWDAPTFKECWPEIEAFIDGNLLIAHNARFDMSVLKACADFAEVLPITYHYNCSYYTAKKVWPLLESYRLSAIAQFLHIPLNHHHALDDARASAQIILFAAEKMNVASLEDLFAEIQLKSNTINL